MSTPENGGHRAKWQFAVNFIITLILASGTAQAGVFRSIIRKVGRVSDDVPVNKADDVAEDLASSPSGRQAMDDVLAKTGLRTNDISARRRAVRKLLRESLGRRNPRLLRQIDELDQSAQGAAVVLARGSEVVREGIPDIAARSRFLRSGGAETVAALGRYDDLIDEAIRFDAAVRAGRITSPRGLPAVTTRDFGRFFRIEGSRARHFWRKYVRPHRKKWLGGAALGAVILTPDKYLDQAGELTEKGLEKLGRLGGSILAGTLEGMIKGAGEATKGPVREAVAAARETFLSDGWGIAALGVLCGTIVLAVPWSRHRVWRLVKRLAGARQTGPRGGK